MVEEISGQEEMRRRISPHTRREWISPETRLVRLDYRRIGSGMIRASIDVITEVDDMSSEILLVATDESMSFEGAKYRAREVAEQYNAEIIVVCSQQK